LSDEQRQLATQFLPLAQKLARNYRYRQMHQRDEIESAAYMALVEAALYFDPARNVNFATFARHRIRGALRDYHHRVCVDHWRGDLPERPVFRRLGKGGEHHGEVLGIQPDRPIGYEIESIESVEDWLRRLPLVHAVVCRYIYINGKSQEEAAALLGCSKSFLSRLHREAIAWLLRDYQAVRAGRMRDPD
jgi:RNA polymerase sigma factor (sigma-70 family)